MGLYENVKNAAKMRNISINQIEKDLGFPRSSIAKFNASVPSSDKIFAIANYLDVSMEYLMTGEDPERITSDGIALSKLDDRTKTFVENYLTLSPDLRKKLEDFVNTFLQQP